MPEVISLLPGSECLRIPNSAGTFTSPPLLQTDSIVNIVYHTLGSLNNLTTHWHVLDNAVLQSETHQIDSTRIFVKPAILLAISAYFYNSIDIIVAVCDPGMSDRTGGTDDFVLF